MDLYFYLVFYIKKPPIKFEGLCDGDQRADEVLQVDVRGQHILPENDTLRPLSDDSACTNNRN